MGTRLVEAANSAYVASQSLLRAASRPEVIIYVEGLDDIPFWTECLQPYMRKYRFSIDVFRKPDGCVADGKRHLLESVDVSALGPNLLVAVDADYDWIIDDYRPSATCASYSRLIRDNDFVLHTYLYSIENYKCHSACVPGLIAKASAVAPRMECEEYFSEYSKAVAELFLAHLVSMELCDMVYPLGAFCSDLDKVRFGFNPLAITEKGRQCVNARLKALESYRRNHSAEISAFRGKLRARGFCDSDYYLLFKGHSVANTVTKRTLQAVVLQMRRQKIREIKAIPDAAQSQQHLAHYCRITGIGEQNHHTEISDRLDQLICDCSDVRKATQGYDRLKADLERLFA